jgi:hypothetical protein
MTNAFRQNETEELLKLFRGESPLYKNNNMFYNKDLYEKLISKLTTYHDDACLRGERSSGNRLVDKICEFTLAYKPNPQTVGELEIDGSLVNGKQRIGNESVNGSNFMSPFHGENIVTKVSKHFTPTILNETFVNMVIINEYLEAYPDAPFVPTYGFFLCPEGPNGEVCSTYQSDKQNHLYISQKMLDDVISFGDYLQQEDGVSVPQMVSLLVKILIALDNIHRFKSYKLVHSDLHTGNILVKRDGSQFWIIDWGMSSFTVNGKRFTNFQEDEYTNCRNTSSVVCGKEGDTQTQTLGPIISGAYDVFDLFSSISNIFYGTPIQPWISYIMSNLFTYYKNNNTLIHSNEYQKSWLYFELTRLTETEYARKENHKILQSQTYHSLLQHIYQICLANVYDNAYSNVLVRFVYELQYSIHPLQEGANLLPLVPRISVQRNPVQRNPVQRRTVQRNPVQKRRVVQRKKTKKAKKKMVQRKPVKRRTVQRRKR